MPAKKKPTIYCFVSATKRDAAASKNVALIIMALAEDGTVLHTEKVFDLNKAKEAIGIVDERNDEIYKKYYQKGFDIVWRETITADDLVEPLIKMHAKEKAKQPAATEPKAKAKAAIDKEKATEQAKAKVEPKKNDPGNVPTETNEPAKESKAAIDKSKEQSEQQKKDFKNGVGQFVPPDVASKVINEAMENKVETTESESTEQESTEQVITHEVMYFDLPVPLDESRRADLGEKCMKLLDEIEDTEKGKKISSDRYKGIIGELTDRLNEIRKERRQGSVLTTTECAVTMQDGKAVEVIRKDTGEVVDGVTQTKLNLQIEEKQGENEDQDSTNSNPGEQAALPEAETGQNDNTSQEPDFGDSTGSDGVGLELNVPDGTA